MGVILTDTGSTKSANPWKTYIKTFIEVFIGLAVVIVPFIAVSALWWSGVITFAIFGVFVGLTGAATVGPKVGIGFTLLFAVFGTAAVAVSSSPILAGLLVAAAAFGIAFCSVYGLTGAMLVVAMFVPYLIHQPPTPSSGGVRGVTYFASVAGVLLVAGLWGCLLGWFVTRHRSATPPPRFRMRDAVLGGSLVAVVAGVITFVAVSRLDSTEWVWLLLTLFVLTKPAPDLNWPMTKSRVFGTVVGVIAASLISLLGLPHPIFTTLGLLALTIAMTLKLLKKPYWIYASFMTPAIIFFDSTTGDTPELAFQRLIYTIVGAAVAVGLAAAINQFVLTRTDGDVPVGTSAAS